MANLLGNFGPALTYEIYIHLGLVIAIPISAGIFSHHLKETMFIDEEMSFDIFFAALDVNYNQVTFEGMKLAGTVMIVSGFLLVLLPENWPDYLTRLLR